ncbi:MAG: tripartite tricarboxylate transporter TctB family protein [Clostridia bacterium]|nr:tripartite tricarboxylate transporter TctB family protein [Clostridia bacterium]
MGWKSNIILAIFLICVGIVGLFLLKDMPEPPAMFPEILFFLLIFFSTVLLISVLKNSKDGSEKKEINYYPVLKITGGLVLYTLIIKILGYLLATFLLVIYIILVMGYPKKLITVVVSLVSVSIIFAIFKLLLNVPLPAGLFLGL